MEEIYPNLVRKIMSRDNLSMKESQELIKFLLEKDNSGEKFLAYSIALQTKGETTEEMLGIFEGLDDLTAKYLSLPPANYMDLSSSGGGKLKKINVSTLSSLVASSREVPIPKQSFFGITSVTGSSDVLAAIGIIVPTIDSRKLKKSLELVGVGFYHHLHISPELQNLVKFGKYLKEREIGLNTPFNLVCPMYTPLNIKYRVFGTNNPSQLETIAKIFQKNGVERGWIVHGVGGMDEISIFGETLVAEIENGGIKMKKITPEEAGLKRCNYEDVKPEDKDSNVKDFLRIAYGLETGAKRDLILINSGAGLYLSKQANSLKEGVDLARQRLDSGEVGKKIDLLVELVGEKEVLCSLILNPFANVP